MARWMAGDVPGVEELGDVRVGGCQLAGAVGHRSALVVVLGAQPRRVDRSFQFARCAAGPQRGVCLLQRGLDDRSGASGEFGDLQLLQALPLVEAAQLVGYQVALARRARIVALFTWAGLCAQTAALHQQSQLMHREAESPGDVTGDGVSSQQGADTLDGGGDGRWGQSDDVEPVRWRLPCHRFVGDMVGGEVAVCLLVEEGEDLRVRTVGEAVCPGGCVISELRVGTEQEPAQLPAQPVQVDLLELPGAQALAEVPVGGFVGE